MKQKLNLPPGPRSYHPLGLMPELKRDEYGTCMQLYRAYGDIVRFRVGVKTMYQVSHPAYLKHMLADNVANYPKNFLAGRRGIVMGEAVSTSEGAFWRRHRRMVQPAFQRERLLAMTPRISQVIERVLDGYWEGPARRGEPIDMLREMSRLVISAMGQLTYSEDPTEELCDAVYHFFRWAGRRRTWGDDLRALLPPPIRTRVLVRRQPKVFSSAYRLDGFARQKVAERRQVPEGCDDMLSILLEVRDEKGVAMTDLEVRDEFIDLFYGGHISTAVGLAWAFYALAAHPHVAERLVSEVDQQLNGRRPEAAELPRLQYVSRVFEEVLRVYPPAPGLTRPAINDDKLGDFDVPAGTLVSISTYVMHRLPEHWKDPDGFDPDHFLPEVVQKRPRYVYVPFGGGQRVCIGAQLALQIATIALSMIVQRYRVSLAPGAKVVPMVGGTHYPEGLWMVLTPVERSVPLPRTASA